MFLEHLASDNGADMHKHNTLYTLAINWHVFHTNVYKKLIVFLLHICYILTITMTYRRNYGYGIYD